MKSMKPDSILVLRTCRSDMTSYNHFVWPRSGPVSAPDWDPRPVCGQGLHGLAWGQGSAELLDWSPDAVWVVVEVPGDVVELHDGGTDKVKFPRGTVVYAGDRHGATQVILSRAPAGAVCHGATVVVGDRGMATAGYGGTATAGYGGTATAGPGGEIRIRYWDGRYRVAIGYVGEGVEADTAYVVRDGKLVKKGGRTP